MNQIIEEVILQDLLTGKTPYIRNSKLHFDCITIGKEEIFISYKGKKLVKWKVDSSVNLDSGDRIIFESDGNLKIKIT